MKKQLILIMLTSLLFDLCGKARLTGEEAQKPKPKENLSSMFLYSPGEGDRLQTTARTSHYRKLIDDKNYELRTVTRIPSINGGETVDREVTETSQRINDGQFKLERMVRVPDPNGRLFAHELVSEDHQLRGTTEEVKRSFYRPDINGKMVAHTVENETIVQVSPTERQSTRALYLPGNEGRFSLAEVEEETEKKVSDKLIVKENSRSNRDANGRMNLAEKVKETTVKLSESSFKKESLVQQSNENGRLVITDKVVETQTESSDGTRKYERLVESRNVNPQIRNVNSTGLILSQRVSAEEKRLADGTVENTIHVETLDPLDLSKGLRLTEIIVETSKPVGSGKVSVERVIKTRDVNGNYIVSQRIAETVQQK